MTLNWFNTDNMSFEPISQTSPMGTMIKSINVLSLKQQIWVVCRYLLVGEQYLPKK